MHLIHSDVACHTACEFQLMNMQVDTTDANWGVLQDVYSYRLRTECVCMRSVD